MERLKVKEVDLKCAEVALWGMIEDIIASYVTRGELMSQGIDRFRADSREWVQELRERKLEEFNLVDLMRALKLLGYDVDITVKRAEDEGEIRVHPF